MGTEGVLAGEVLLFKRGVFVGTYVVGALVVMYVIWLVGKSLRTIFQKSIA